MSSQKSGRSLARRFLGLFGYRVEYVCGWGTYSHRYDGADSWMCRPIHQGMSVAPPWAKLKITRA